eukprot:Transcript_17769.p1 GENE.Transcript_17769~~Transcript_17769.p1  ORF type:complete len:456 (-),score=208.71 Transcript_17769:558-1925(-)
MFGKKKNKQKVDLGQSAAPPAPQQPAPAPSRGGGEQVQVEVIPKSLEIEQQLISMRQAKKPLNAERLERLLDLPQGQVQELKRMDNLFDFVEELGCGECATVYRAIRRDDGEVMALKVLQYGAKGNIAAEATSMAMARNELRALSALPRHEGVMQLLGVWCTETQLAFGLELLDSGDLLVPIERSGGAIPEPDALVLFAQLARGVRHMHAHGWAHRDLKPENICMAPPRRNRDEERRDAAARGEGADAPLRTLRVKIIDFGTAAPCEPRQSTLHGLCGTPAYVAPEVAAWAPDQCGPKMPPPYGLPADIWSLGVTLYVMLSGECPWNQEVETAEMLRQISREEARLVSPAWRRVSKEAKQLVQAMLTRSVDKRLTAAQVVAHPWLASQRHLDAETRAAAPQQPPAAIANGSHDVDSEVGHDVDRDVDRDAAAAAEKAAAQQAAAERAAAEYAAAA